MSKRIFTKLAAGVLCGALLFTDAASLNVWAVSNELDEEQIAPIEVSDEESDTSVINEEDEEKKEAEEPEEDVVPVKEDGKEAALPVEEEPESVSENAVEEKLNVNSVMAASEEIIASGKSGNISWRINVDGKRNGGL